jgi:periplasmic protein TonB
MIKSLGHLGMIAAFAGASLVGAMSLDAQAQDTGSSPAHVDTSGANAQPAYPPTAITNAEQGVVAVNVFVNKDGKASKPQLERSSGFDDLDNAAIAAALSWKYVPAMEGGVPRSNRLTVAINFQLPNSIPAQASH